MTRTVIAVVDDLFFASKIRGTAEQLGVTVSFPKTSEAVIEGALQNSPAMIILDLNSQQIDPIELAKQLKADARLQEIPLVGFFSHVQTELQQQAQAAGIDRVMPRSAFTTKLPQIIGGEI